MPVNMQRVARTSRVQSAVVGGSRIALDAAPLATQQILGADAATAATASGLVDFLLLLRGALLITTLSGRR